MPAWSYGHRLYKAAWFEEADGAESCLEVGPYRHSNGLLFRKFKHSWPLFRRHVSLAARVMAQGSAGVSELDAAEQAALTYGDRPAYLESTFWPEKNPELFYASIDLEKFYPSITKSAILAGFAQHMEDFSGDQWLMSLLDRMLDFRIGKKHSELLGNPIVEPFTPVGAFPHVPTGLMVAGFLSNVAMMSLDRVMDERALTKRRVAHFRFVDDHAFLAHSFEDLVEWI